MLNKTKILLVILFVVITCSTLLYAENKADNYICTNDVMKGWVGADTESAVEVSFTVTDNFLNIPGYRLKPGNITPENTKSNNFDIFSVNSPDKSRSLIQAGIWPGGPWDFWLIDNAAKTAVKIENKISSRHVSVFWRGNSIFGLCWARNNDTVSEVFDADSPRKYMCKKNLCLIDEKSNIYIADKKDMEKRKCYIIAGKLFSNLVDTYEAPDGVFDIESNDWIPGNEFNVVFKEGKLFICLEDGLTSTKVRFTWVPDFKADETACACDEKTKMDNITITANTSSEVEHELMGNVIFIPGYKFTLKENKVKDLWHNMIYAYVTTSPDEKHSVVRVGNYPAGPWDMWLVDNAKKTYEVLKVDLTGGHLGVSWPGNDLISFFTGGMGYNSTQLLKLGPKKQQINIEDMCYLDYDRGLYLAGVKDFKKKKCYLVIGRLFSKAIEKMPLPDDIYHAEWQAFAELKAEIQGNKVHVHINSHDTGEDNLDFEPNLLKK